MNEYGVVIFPNTTSAIRAEKALLRAGYRIKLIPNPRRLSNSCGLALRFDWSETAQIKALLEQAPVEIMGIFQM